LTFYPFHDIKILPNSGAFSKTRLVLGKPHIKRRNSVLGEAVTIALTFNGYYREEQLPLDGHNYSGLYLVYAGRRLIPKKIDLNKLLYIGESGNIAAIPKGEPNYSSWENCLKIDEILLFAFASIAPHNRKRAAAALIYYHKPLCNGEEKNHFDYPQTLIRTYGCNRFLTGSFVVGGEAYLKLSNGSA
jgi:hypothetical protein